MASALDLTSEGSPTGAVVRSCFEEFKQCIQQLEGKDKIHVQTRFADLRLWADSVGATAQAKASLDWRFQHRPNDLYFIRGHLSMLEGFLKECFAAANDKSDICDIIANIDSTVDSLAFIGVQIRRSGRKSRLRRADDSFDQNRDEYRKLRAHLACIVASKPTKEGRPKDEGKEIHSIDYFANLKLPQIQERLVEANLRRRHRFIEAQRHSHGLKDPSTKPSHTISQQQFIAMAAIHTNQEVSPMQGKREATTMRQKQAHPTGPRTDVPTMPATSASGIDSTWGGLRNKRQPGSTVTRITAITAAARYPRAQTLSNPDQQLVKCPCCCQAIPATELEDSQWRKHVANDLCPYTCVLEDCPTPYNLFVTQKEWNDHVMNDHPPQWQCPCCEGDPPMFKSLSSIISHMVSKHPNVNSNNLEDLLSSSEISVMGITKCPLCDSEGPQDSPDLVEHVLHHVHEFSLRSLPWPMDPTISLEKPVGIFDMSHAEKIIRDDTGNEHIFHIAEWAETVVPIFDLSRGVKIFNDPEGNELDMDIAGWPENTTLEGELSLQLCDIDQNPPKTSEEESTLDTPSNKDYFSQNEYFADESSDGRFPSQTSRSSQQTQIIDFFGESFLEDQYADDSSEQDRDVNEASRPQHMTIRYKRTSEIKDLQDDIKLARRKVESIPEDHPNWAGWLNTLGIRLSDRYSRTGSLADLEEAIQIMKTAVKATPADHADKAERLNNLGIQFGKRYTKTGEMADLEYAIQIMQNAVEMTPADHSNRAAVLSNLGNSFRHMFELTRGLNDINEAIGFGEEAIAVTPHDHPDRAAILSHLANSLCHKFKRTSDLQDLNEAISIGKEAVAATPHDHPDGAAILTNLSNSFYHKFEWTHDLQALIDAISIAKQAVFATPNDHPDRAAILSHLANSLYHKFKQTSDLQDLNEAISIGKEAVAATPHDHPDREAILSMLEFAKSGYD
ncbi:uncharacterized protein PV07_09763 [Cladophialophora immunda]|uniref:C2H2-type domain-containing protein n=1 Tax=Cladophialophora immunda TaxID=569365 RepID=A0A0D2CKI6_9EURO|nr:uncharacterized protein PV07_09763 [Cladophialophora immunda]KIW24024.1 hypothetical protein PV07_09763 [Cladophialophora immunda]